MTPTRWARRSPTTGEQGGLSRVKQGDRKGRDNAKCLRRENGQWTKRLLVFDVIAVEATNDVLQVETPASTSFHTEHAHCESSGQALVSHACLVSVLPFRDASKKILNDPSKFLDSLLNFDKDNIGDSIIKKVEPYIQVRRCWA